MAGFDRKYLALSSSGFSRKAPQIITYRSTTDLIATIITSAYFNDFINELDVNDLMWLVGTDASGLYKVTSVTTNVTVAAI